MIRETIIFYKSFFDAIDGLAVRTQVEAYRAILRYGLYGQEPDTGTLSPMAKAVYLMAKPQIDANFQRFINGQKGGAPKGNQNARKNAKNNQKQPKTTNGYLPFEGQENGDETTEKQPKNNQKQPNVNVNDNEKENVNVNAENIDNIIFSSPNGEVSTSRPKKNNDKISLQIFVNKWNAICGPAGLPTVTALSQSRRNHLNARIAEWGTTPAAALNKAEEIFTRITRSEFLLGVNERSWRADFNWIIRNPDNWVKVIEGNYGNNQQTTIDYDRSGNNGNTRHSGGGNNPAGTRKYTETDFPTSL